MSQNTVIYPRNSELPQYCSHPLLNVSRGFANDTGYENDELEIYLGPGTLGLHSSLHNISRAIATNRLDVRVVEAIAAIRELDEAVSYNCDDGETISCLAAFEIFEDRGENCEISQFNPVRYKERVPYIRHMNERILRSGNDVPQYDECYYDIISRWVAANTRLSYREFYSQSSLKFCVNENEYMSYAETFSRVNTYTLQNEDSQTLRQ